MLRFLRDEGGQTLVLIALFVAFAFIGLTALAIDGGFVYLNRRDLQNKADAACLAAAQELALGGTVDEARTAAITNLTANNIPSTFYEPALGSGVNLVKGIEIVDSDVRVALQRLVPGFFVNLIGRQGWLVPARAHCDSVAAGGLLPIAVKRYGEDDLNQTGWVGWEGNDGSSVDCTSPGEGYSCDTRYNLVPQGPGSTPGNVVDYSSRYYADPSGPSGPDADVLWQWPGFATAGYPGDPITGTHLYSPPNPHPALDDPSGGGRSLVMLGEGARPNVAGGMDFRDFVALDVRCLTCPVRQYIPPIEPGTAANTLKDVAMSYIQQKGYTGPIPRPGEQVAILSGTDASQAARSMEEWYDVGEIIPVLVYNGQVQRRPNFDITVACVSNCSVNTSLGQNILYPSYAEYNMTLCPVNGFISPGITLSAYIGDPNWQNPLLRWGVASWSLTEEQWQRTAGIIDTSCISHPLYVWQDSVIPIDGTQVIFIDAYDAWPGTQIRRPGRTPVEVNPTNDFRFTILNPYRVIERPEAGNDNIDWELQFVQVGTGGGTISVETPYWSDSFGTPGGVAPSGVTLSIRTQGGRRYLRTTLNSSATLGAFYVTVVTVNEEGDRHMAVIEMTIKEAATGTTASGMDAYVQVLGYGLLQIERFDANSVSGHFIEPIFTDPSRIMRGFRPRLLPW